MGEPRKDAEPKTNTKIIELDSKPFADIVTASLTTASSTVDASSLVSFAQ